MRRRAGRWATDGRALLLPCALGGLGFCLIALSHACTTVAGLDDLSFEASSANGIGGGATTTSTTGEGGNGAARSSSSVGGGGGAALDAYAMLILSHDPVGYWRLDDVDTTAADASGLGQDGTYSGAYALERGGVLDGNSAVEFFGGNGEIEVSTDAFRFSGIRSFTIEAWVNAGMPGGVIAGVKGFDPVLEHTGWWLSVSLGGTVRFERAGTGPGAVIADSSADSVVGTWNHVVASFNGDNSTATLYVNGSLVRSTVQTMPLIEVNEPFIIGNAKSWGGMEGRIDEVAVYAYALALNDIEQHYALGRMLQSSEQ